MAAVDYLYWSPPLEGLASGAGRSGEMWITGKASATAAAKLAALGWKVVRTGRSWGVLCALCLAQRGHLIYSTRVQV